MTRGRARLPLQSIALVGSTWLAGCGGDTVVLGDGRSAAAAGIPSFSQIAVVDSISAPGTVDDDPSLTSDLRQIYFDSKRDGGAGQEDIWRSGRDGPTDAWGPPEPVTELNTADRETGIFLSGDGLSIWFSSNRADGLGGLDVFTSTRRAIGDTWPTAQRVDDVSSPDDDLVSAVDASTTTLFLARRASADGDYDIYTARRPNAGDAWGSPEPLVELNTSKEESDAFPVERDTGIVFTRAEDLAFASRKDPSEPYRFIGPLASLNSADDDRDPWATDDMSYVVFSSNRSGEYLLYEARK